MHTRIALAVLAALIVVASALVGIGHAAGPSALPRGTAPWAGAHPAPYVAPHRSSHPTPTAIHPSLANPAQTIIWPNGTISNSSAPINRSGNTYTLTASFIGGILDERNGSTLVGNGKTLTMDISLYQAIFVFQASEVLITGMNIVSVREGIYIQGSTAIAVFSNNITATWSVDAEYSSAIVVSHLNAQNGRGVYGYLVAGYSVSNSNLSGSSSEAFYADYSSNISIVHVTAWNSLYGFDVEYSSGFYSFGDNVSGTSEGIYAYDDSFVTSAWTNGSFDGYLVYVEYSHQVTVTSDAGIGVTYAIYAYEVNGITVTGLNTPGSSEYGVYAEYSADIVVTNSKIQRAGYEAVYLDYVQGATFTNVNASGYWYEGIYAEYTGELSVVNSQFSDSAYVYGYGVETYECIQISIMNSDLGGSYNGYYDEYSANITLTHNDISHTTNSSEAVYVEYDSHVQILGNNIFNSSYYGVYAYETNSLLVSGNNVSQGGYYAFYLEYVYGATIENNSADHAWGYGLYLDEGAGVSIVDNTFDHVRALWGYAVYIEYLAGGLVSGNLLNHVNTSIYAYEDASVGFVNNNASNAYWGAYPEYCSNVSFVGNMFESDHFGFEIYYNGPVTFYHNNFISDAGWVNDSGINLISWSGGYPLGGNYWSNHTTPTFNDSKSGPLQNVAGADGIVDTPFVINATNQDPYPLASPWTAHSATFTENTLKAGTMWSVTIGGSTWSTTGSSIVFWEPNAADSSYPYSVGHVAGYNAATPSSGTVQADRTNSVINVVFTPFNYTVTFHETGLKAGTSWNVVVQGVTLTGNTTDLTVNEPNGSWSYTTQNVTGYALTTGPGSVTVQGATASVTVAYVAINPGGNGNGNGTTSSSNTYSQNVVFGLAAGLILALILAALGFALWARSRRPKQPAAAAPWTPPPASGSPPPASPPPSGGASPPPGAFGGSP